MIKTINDCPQSPMWDTRWCDHVVCVCVIICSSHSNVLLLLSRHPPPSINPSLPQNIVYSTWITKNDPCVPNAIWSRNQLISCYSVLLRDVTTSSIISFSPKAQKQARKIQFDGLYFPVPSPNLNDGLVPMFITLAWCPMPVELWWQWQCYIGPRHHGVWPGGPRQVPQWRPGDSGL